MSKIRYYTVKILKSGIVHLVYKRQTKTQGKFADGNEELEEIPHPDFIKAMASLRVHWALNTGQLKSKQVPDINNVNEDLIEKIHVSGYHLKGPEDDKWIIITGHRQLENGKTIGINTPKIRLEDQSDEAYEHIEDMKACIAVIESEVGQYMAGNKFGIEAQTKIDFPEEQTGAKVTNIKIAKHADNGIDQDDIDKKHRAAMDKKETKGPKKKAL